MFGQTEGVKTFLLSLTRSLMRATHSVFWHGMFLVAFFQKSEQSFRLLSSSTALL